MPILNFPAKYGNNLETFPWPASGFYSAVCSNFTTPVPSAMPVTNFPENYGNELATLTFSESRGVLWVQKAVRVVRVWSCVVVLVVRECLLAS